MLIEQKSVFQIEKRLGKWIKAGNSLMCSQTVNSLCRGQGA